MCINTESEINNLHDIGNGTDSVLEDLAREGARRILQEALENEIVEFLDKHAEGKDGQRIVVRNGHMRERSILFGIGPIPIKKPRVDDRKLRNEMGEEGFSSKILPKFLRRVPSLDKLIPVLYLKGISTTDFPTALEAILGKNAPGLSASNIVRLKAVWEKEYEEWSKRDLSEKEYAYIWVDGIYFNVRLDKDRPCILVIMGADKHGKKELIAVKDGFRESEISWKEMLLDLKDRGLDRSPKLAIGDGALGFWKAIDQVYPDIKQQRCWVHKTANILDKLPKSVQPEAKESIHEMYMAPSRKIALKEFDKFVTVFGNKYPKAVKCLTKSKDQLFTFYDFPEEHWSHIRTTNPIESTFATVRLRTRRTKGCGSRRATLTMVFKLGLEAQKNWRRLKGYRVLPFVLENRVFNNGMMEKLAS